MSRTRHTDLRQVQARCGKVSKKQKSRILEVWGYRITLL
jgi:hypothetical protein